MKLEYIWIEKYNQFENIEFNFSSSNRFTYQIDELSKILKHINCDNRYKDFFNNYTNNKSKNRILDIIAITGSNGVGKSTLLKMISELVSYRNGYISNTEFIMVISDNKDNFEIYSNINDLITPSKLNSVDFNYEYFDLSYNDTKTNPIGEKLNVLYYSNSFDINSILDEGLRESDNIFDLSTMRILDNDRLNVYSNSGRKISEVKNHFYLEFNRQIDFILECKNSFKHIKNRLPKKIIINIKELDKRIDMLISIVELEYSRKDAQNLSDDNYDIREVLTQELTNLKYIFNTIIDDPYIKEKEYFIICLIYICLIETLEYKIDIDKVSELRYEYEYSTIDMIQKLNKSLNYKDLIEKFIELEDYTYTLSYSEEIVKLLKSNNKEILDPLKFTGTDRIIEYNIDEIESQNKKMMIKDFYEKFCKIGLLNGMLGVSWPLSSGENNLLNMYSRIYCFAADYIKSMNHRNILLLIDEAEISYHPRWQQEYIKSIIDLINDIFIDTNIHIIFTTHSPIVLSDIPEQNVVYIYNNKISNKDHNSIAKNGLTKTFGANIYNLYNNSFFLNESPVTGIIGSYANDKINKAMKDLNEITKFCNELKGKKIETNKQNLYEKKMECAKSIIDIIGDQLTKDILLEMYIDTKKILDSVRASSKVQEIYGDLTSSEKRELIDLILRSTI